jgi:L-ascorbate metabolism protein UlaG (beta-lactamase superfamily)
MKLTKFAHACAVVEHDGKKLLIDPGIFTDLPDDLANIACIVITHVHPDHMGTEKLQRVITANPEVKIFTVPEVAEQLQDHPNVIEVLDGDTEEVSGFSLEFFGGEHATIHPDLHGFENIGVLINNILYYPGDSFSLPAKPVQVLLVPASAPWLKISEAMDFLTAIKPQVAIPTHDAILSSEGKMLHDRWLALASEQIHCTYKRLQPGESIDI